MKKLIPTLCLSLMFCFSVCAQSCETSAHCGITVDTLPGLKLNVFYPNYRSVDLACGTMPSEKDEAVIFCAAASFTGQLLDEFKHSNIMGPHISGGKQYNGYNYGKHYGLFSAVGQEWSFSVLPAPALLDSVAAGGGMAFTQHWVIKSGDIYRPTTMSNLDRMNYYRVIANFSGRLCVIESTEPVTYGTFINSLKSAGVVDALYMDMGPGWNYSFYRDEKGVFHRLHPKNATSRYATNWITFRK